MSDIGKLLGQGRERPPALAVALAVLALCVTVYAYVSSPLTVAYPITAMGVIAAFQVTRSRPAGVRLRAALLTFGSMLALSLSWVWLRRSVDASGEDMSLVSFWLAMTLTIGVLLYGSYRVSEVFWFRSRKIRALRAKSRRSYMAAVAFHAFYSSFQIALPSAIIAFRAGPLVVAGNPGWLVGAAVLASTACGTTLALEKLRPSRRARARAAAAELNAPGEEVAREAPG